MLESSSITEPSQYDPPLWEALTNYPSVDSLVFRPTTHKIYKNLVAITGSVSNDPPEVSITRMSPKWAEVSFTNRWASLDIYNTGYSTSDSDEISMTLAPGELIDSLAIMRLRDVISVSVKAYDINNALVYSNTVSLSSRTRSQSWYEYFFNDFSIQSVVTLYDIPTSYGVLKLDVVISGGMGLQIGGVVLGTSYEIGRLQRGPVIESMNFSSLDRDTFGNISRIVVRRTVPKINTKVFIPPENLNTVLQVRHDLEAVPALWIGVDDISLPYYIPLSILGFYRDFSIDIDHPGGIMATIELEQL